MKFQQSIWSVCLGVVIVLAAVGIMEAENIETTIEAKQDKPGIFCKLSTVEMRERVGKIRATFLNQVIGVDELETGYRYWFEKTPERLSMLAEFIDSESHCCAFFQFDLSLAPQGERVSLSLTGREGAKELLENTMQSAEFDWQATLHDS